MLSVVEKLNNLPSVKRGTFGPLDALANLQKHGSKVESIEGWLNKEGLTWEDCAYIGDDRTDWESMQKAFQAARGLYCAAYRRIDAGSRGFIRTGLSLFYDNWFASLSHATFDVLVAN